MPILQMRDLRQEATTPRLHGRDVAWQNRRPRCYSVCPMLLWNPHTNPIRRHFPSPLTEGENGIQTGGTTGQPAGKYWSWDSTQASLSHLEEPLLPPCSWGWGEAALVSECPPLSPHSPWGERSCHAIQGNTA